MTSEHTITLDSWQFLIGDDHGEWFIRVPDRGGMADSVPQVPEQLAWAEKTLAALPELVQVWPTSWRVPTSSLPALELLLRRHGAQWPSALR